MTQVQNAKVNLQERKLQRNILPSLATMGCTEWWTQKKKKKQNRLFTGKQEQEKVEKEVASAFKIQLPHYRTDEAPLSPNTSYRYQVIQELATTVKFFSVLPF